MKTFLRRIFSKIPKLPIPKAVSHLAKGVFGWAVIKTADTFDIISPETHQSTETNSSFFIRAYDYSLIINSISALQIDGLILLLTFRQPASETKVTLGLGDIRKPKKRRKAEQRLAKLFSQPLLDREAIILADKQEIRDKLVLVKLMLDLGVSVTAFASLLDNLNFQREAGINIWGLSWPEGITPSRVPPFMEPLNVPLSNTVNVGLIFFNSTFILYKLLLALKHPHSSVSGNLLTDFLSGILNYSAYVRISNKIFKNPRTFPSEIVFPAGSSLKEILKEFEYWLPPPASNLEASKEIVGRGWNKSIAIPLSYYAAFQIYDNAVRMIFNVFDLFFNQLETELQELDLVAEEPLQRHPQRGLHFSYPPSPRLSVVPEGEPKSSPSLASSEASSHALSLPEVSNQQETRKQKVKTRGISKVEYIQPHAQTSDVPRQPVFSYRSQDHKIRHENLVIINRLRLKNQASNQEIYKLFSSLLAHLPLITEKVGSRMIQRTPYIEKLDGSERRLGWFYQDLDGQIKEKSLKFEEHGKYEGTYLRKALNVIEAAFLWGWDKIMFEQHMTTRPKQTKLEQIMQVISERPRASYG